jgi:hypothetical protein
MSEGCSQNPDLAPAAGRYIVNAANPMGVEWMTGVTRSESGVSRLGKELMQSLIFAIAAIAVTNSSALAQGESYRHEWPNTDFSHVAIDLSEVMSGGPPRDGIPAILDPMFINVVEEQRLDDREPVLIYLPEKGPARAYPIRYLIWHEIVNDVVDEQPIAVTFCPLCNTAMVFDARVDGKPLTFGVSGLLRHSDMIMYDHQTESWWQQAQGNAFVGSMTGKELTQLPSWMEGWAAFRKTHPDGLVMEEPNWRRAYGTNPYQNYDTSRPFLYSGENPPHGIDPVERVVRVGNRAWPLSRLRREMQIAEAGLILVWTEGQASALDTGSIGQGREVGNVRVRDQSGRDVAHDIPFAFAFHAFHPNGKWMLGNHPD